MANTSERLIETISAEAADGRRFTLYVYQEIVTAPAMTDKSSIAGLKSVRTREGMPYRVIDADTWEILDVESVMVKRGR